MLITVDSQWAKEMLDLLSVEFRQAGQVGQGFNTKVKKYDLQVKVIQEPPDQDEFV